VVTTSEGRSITKDNCLKINIETPFNLEGVFYFYVKLQSVSISELYLKYLEYPVIATDTRKLQKDCIYFALRGDNFDGNRFAIQALDAGAAYAVVDYASVASDPRCILVDNVLDTLQQLAHHHRMQFGIPFIAITGSNGKTTTKELLAAVLAKKFVTAATVGNLNNHIGVPLTLLKIGRDVEMAVIEMGANHQQEIAGYCKVATPTHGIITNCGKAHIEGFGGEEGVRKGKGELYDYLRLHDGIVFRNTDLDYLAAMAAGIGQQITYGTHEGDYTGTGYTDGVFLSIKVADAGVVTAINTKLVGAYNFHNAMTAIAVGMHFGIPMPDIKAALEAYTPDNSRSQWITRGTNRIILDAYNANPTSMKAAISNFAGMDMPNKVLWIGGMKEMGTAEQYEHEQLINLIAGYNWQQVLLVGNEFKAVAHSYQWFPDSAQAAAYVAAHMPANSAILIKGSRGSKMEVMLDVLTDPAQ
jgi:UDP-N-acetylmuramoyl-tripeptide--D-alanyl-D-alanine ligase